MDIAALGCDDVRRAVDADGRRVVPLRLLARAADEPERGLVDELALHEVDHAVGALDVRWVVRCSAFLQHTSASSPLNDPGIEARRVAWPEACTPAAKSLTPGP